MTDPASITPERLRAALVALTLIQAKPKLNAHQMRMRVWDALDALAPEIAILPALEAYETVVEDALP